MGVPRLVKIILEKYDKCHQHVQGQKINYFFMDFNPIIYNCYRDVLKQIGQKANTISQPAIERAIIDEVIKKTQHMICDVVKPTKLVYIAIDGPAPRGKMIQQRHRRYRKILEKRQKAQLKLKYGIYEEEPWDTSNITPGTKFMEKLSTALRKAARAGTFSTHAPVDVMLSDSNVPGEGEHKFLSFIEGIHSKVDERFCIFSNDGDLLILGNRFAKDKDIYLLTQPNQTSQVVQKLYANDEFMYILLKEFQVGFIEELEFQDYEPDRIISDYMFYTFFGGNDFVKHFPYTMMKEQNTFNLLNRIYKMLLEEHQDYLVSFTATNQPRINTKFFKDFIAELAKREEMGMRNKQKRYNNHVPNVDYSNSKDKPEWEQEFLRYQNNYYYKEDHPQYETYAKMFQVINYDDTKQNWKARYYQHFFDLDTTHSFLYKKNRSIIGLQYVKSLVYTLRYYLNEVPSWTWYYPYRMAPMPSDVQSALHHIDDINTIFQFQKGQPFKPLDQLMLVLPPQNVILPKVYRDLMSDSALQEYYPEEFELDVLAGEKFIYSEPLLPKINVGKVLAMTAKNESKLTEAEQRRNKIKNTITFIPRQKQTLVK